MSNPYVGPLSEDLEKAGWQARPADDGYYKTIIHPERLATYYVNILHMNSDCYIEIRKLDQVVQKVVYCQDYPTTVPELMAGGKQFIEDLLLEADNEYIDGRYIDMRNRAYMRGLQ